MSVLHQQHGADACAGRVFKADPASECLRIVEGSKEHVPQRQITKVAGVMITLMVQAMRFRTLNNVAEPTRRMNVPMLEHTEHRCEKTYGGCGDRRQSKQKCPASVPKVTLTAGRTKGATHLLVIKENPEHIFRGATGSMNVSETI
jgi:hypothetical protein